MVIAKTDILCELGHDRLLKPPLIERAVAANEQAKYYLTLLQNARAHAKEPAAHVAELRRERITAGVSDAALDGVVASAHNSPKTPTALRPPLTSWRASGPPSRR